MFCEPHPQLEYTTLVVSTPVQVRPLRYAKFDVGTYHIAGDIRQVFRRINEQRLVASGVVRLLYHAAEPVTESVHVNTIETTPVVEDVVHANTIDVDDLVDALVAVAEAAYVETSTDPASEVVLTSVVVEHDVIDVPTDVQADKPKRGRKPKAAKLEQPTPEDNIEA